MSNENRDAAVEALEQIDATTLYPATMMREQLLGAQISATAALARAVIYVGDQVGDIPG